MDMQKLDLIPKKLSRLLLELSKWGTQIIAGVTFQELANEIGARRETVAALIRDFHKERWIRVKYQELTVLDIVPLIQPVRVSCRRSILDQSNPRARKPELW